MGRLHGCDVEKAVQSAHHRRATDQIVETATRDRSCVFAGLGKACIVGQIRLENGDVGSIGKRLRHSLLCTGPIADKADEMVFWIFADDFEQSPLIVGKLEKAVTR